MDIAIIMQQFTQQSQLKESVRTVLKYSSTTSSAAYSSTAVHMYLMQSQHPAPVRTDFKKKIGVTTKFSKGMSIGVATAVLFIVVYLSIDSSQTVYVQGYAFRITAVPLRGHASNARGRYSTI
jgi:hypothetical protein